MGLGMLKESLVCVFEEWNPSLICYSERIDFNRCGFAVSRVEGMEDPLTIRIVEFGSSRMFVGFDVILGWSVSGPVVD